MDIIPRLLILNPAIDEEDARKVIAALYEKPPADEWIPAKFRDRHSPWRPLCHQFNVPQSEARKWHDAAQMGVDVPRMIGHWLDSIGVTEALLANAEE